jgi:hypothetical protein
MLFTLVDRFGAGEAPIVEGNMLCENNMHDCLWYKKRGLLYDTITQHAIIYGTMI